MSFAIQTEKLTKHYRRGWNSVHPALIGMSLQIPTGSAFGLVGPNGAGKTTFIKLLLGIAVPTSGEIKVLGSTPDSLEVKRRIGYLPERMGIPPAWTPLEWLSSIANYKQLKIASTALRLQLERVGIASSAEHRVGSFSKGMKQRLGLAGALLGSPELLILDEPTDGIDPIGRLEVRHILEEEKKRGATLLLNSHLLSETEKICDRIGILSKGALAREGSLSELLTHKNRWRARFSNSVTESALSPLGFIKHETMSGWFSCEAASAEDLNQQIDAVRRVGIMLLELHAETTDLEVLFQETVQSS